MTEAALPAWTPAEWARKHWPQRMLTDYLDDAVGRHPDKAAIVDFNSMSGKATTLTFRQLAAHRRPHGGGARLHGRQKGHHRRLPIAELVAIRSALSRLRAPGRDHQSADADLPPARIALHARLCRSRSDGGAATLPRLRLSGHARGNPRRPAAPEASIGDRRQRRRLIRAAPARTALGRRDGPRRFIRARSALAQRYHPTSLHLGHHRRAERRDAYLEHAAQHPGQIRGATGARRRRHHLHGLAHGTSGGLSCMA